MNIIERRKAAEAASLSRMGTAILEGHKLNVKFLPEGAPELGFTSGREMLVNVAWYNEMYFKMLTEIEQSVLRMGIFAHEVLRQCFTNFRYTNTLCDTMSRAEAAVFMKFANTLEDPAIEYFAPNIMGGTLLDALRFSIRHIYKLSPGIECSKSPFSQLINALIHFGDMGIIKGSFTYSEAYEYFKKVAPLYNEGITCPDSKRRIDIAKECMLITKPLWEEDVKNEELFEKLIEELMEALKRSGLHLKEGDESEMSEPEEDGVSGRRGLVLERMSSGSSDKSDENEDGDSSSSGKKEDEDNKDSDGEGSSDDKDGKEDESESSSSSKSAGNPPKDGSSPKKDSGSDVTTSQEEANNIAEEEIFEIDEDVFRKVEENIKKEEARITKSEKETSSKCDAPSFDITSTAFKSASCLNIKMANNASACGLSALYKKMVSECSYEIKNLTKALDKIFKSDMEEHNRATSGSYNIMRGSIGTTARIFDKRRDPGNLRDAQIVLAVDLSGSMSGSKIAQARKTSIILAESLTNLNIPYYIMGYTADRGADAVHHHFVDWDNKKKDRETLACMQAGGNNFDGYSIRYAAELLRGRSSNHKILFVISDGEPACCKYHGMSVGLSDTTNAIKEARKFCTVFGIALGRGCSPQTLQKMYGRDFIHCEDEKLLSNTLSKKLEKVLKSGK